MNLKNEPAVLITTITAVLTEVFGLAFAFGVNVSDAQQTAIISTVTALAGLIALLGPVVRQFVVSPQSAADAVIQAKQDVGGGFDVPKIAVAGDSYGEAVKAAGFVSTPPSVN